MFEILSDFLKTQDVEYHFNVKLGDLSPIKIGANAACLIYPRTQQSFLNVLTFLRKEQIEYKIFGRMSNVLLVRDEYNLVVIKTDRLDSYRIYNGVLEAETGVVLASIALKLASLGYGGISELSGIPGSVGGLIRMCAGAYGKDISDILISVTVYDTDKDEIFEIPSSSITFSYRYCSLDRSLVILKAKFALSISSTEEILKEISYFRKLRKASQPTNSRTLGSIFKRPNGAYASKMIDTAGLKGARIGDACVSEQHAGFIVNSGEATYKDVLNLMDLVADRVYSMYGVRLEPEIEMF